MLHRKNILLFLTGLALGLHWVLMPAESFAARKGKLKLITRDADSNHPVAVRMHLFDAKGKPVLPPKTPAWKDHFAFEDEITLNLPLGRYTFEIERGPEYKDYKGNFEIKALGDGVETIKMHRIVDLTKEGWWSGEMHIHRPLDQIELAMKAEDLHIGPVISWWKGLDHRWVIPTEAPRGIVKFDENRYYSDLVGEDERRGGAILYYGLPGPADLSQATQDYPSMLGLLNEARQSERVHIDIEKPFWWDVPVWLASGRIDSIGIINNHIWRDGMRDDEAWGRPRNRDLYPPQHGNGMWSEAIYYHILNCGLRIAPSAGSASGVMTNPIGYNRVYVHCEDDFSYEKWFENLRAGRVFITNGPLLRATVEGEYPGHTFEATKGETLEFEVALNLSTREKIDYLEIIKDGEPIINVRLDQFKESRGRLPKVPFEESGWFLVRVVTENEKTYRYAATGAFYVEYDGQPRISRSSAQFFVDWIDERIKHIEKNDLTPADKLTDEQRQQIIGEQKTAREFWQNLVETANAK